jgi:hypothetical protein
MPDVPRQRTGMDPADQNGQKLDRIGDAVTDVRLAVATLGGDVRATLQRLDGHDNVAGDVEKRLRVIERRLYAIPGIATLVSLGSLALALYVAFTRH